MDKHTLFHPPIDVKNFKDNEEIMIINCIKNGNFDMDIMDAHFQYLPKHGVLPVNHFSMFLDSPACRNFKAVFFLLVDLDNVSHFVNMEIRQMVYEEVRKRKWNIYLVHPKTVSIMSFVANIDSKPGDLILNVVSMGEKITANELQRKNEGYSYVSCRTINRLNRRVNDLRNEILGICNPKYVIVFDPENNGLMKSLKSRFVPSKNVINIDFVQVSEDVPQVVKAIFERGHNQLVPFSMDDLAVTYDTNLTDADRAVITVEGYNDLPLERIKVVPKSKKPYYVAFHDTISGTYKPAGKAQLSKEQGGHRIKLALVVDRNSLPFLYQDPFIIPEIQALPQKLSSSKADYNVPVIGFFDNSSVICVRDENRYKFLNEWNSLYGNDLFLCFEQEKPTYVADFNKVKSKDPFVVYDLIKILSMPPNVLKADPNWGFKVTSSSDNPVLIEIETFLGSRKSATPVFMMALLLKHHIKAIKKETGKKPKELGFCLFNQFSNEEKNRIQSGLQEACKLLKIGFVVTNV